MEYFIMQKKGSWGGAREGSGRKKVTATFKKKQYGIAIQPWIIEAVDRLVADGRYNSRAEAIEFALANTFELEEPDKKKTVDD